MTFGQRFKIINAGKLLASGTANGTGVMNNEKMHLWDQLHSRLIM